MEAIQNQNEAEALTLGATEARIQNVAAAVMNDARRLWPHLQLREPGVAFFYRGLKAGVADYTRWEVRLNVLLLSRVPTAELDNTVAHECAHLIARQVHHPHNIRPHGPEWQRIMRTLGFRPDRTHSYDVTGLRAKPKIVYPYDCRCSYEHWLGPKKHRAVEAGRRKYVCKRCRVQLRPSTARLPRKEG